MRDYPLDSLLENVWNAARRFLLLWRGWDTAGPAGVGRYQTDTWHASQATSTPGRRMCCVTAANTNAHTPASPGVAWPMAALPCCRTVRWAARVVTTQIKNTAACTCVFSMSVFTLAGLYQFSSESKRMKTISKDWHYLTSRKLFPFSLLLSDLVCQIRLILAAIKANNRKNPVRPQKIEAVRKKKPDDG